MTEPYTDEEQLAYTILTGIQRIMKGPGKRYWTYEHHRFDAKTGRRVRTHKCCVGGDIRWTPAYMTYDPDGPSLVIFATVAGDPNHELLRIDLTDPKCLTRVRLRGYFKLTIERYAEDCRQARLHQQY